MKCLVDKKYITQKKYKEIWNDLFKEKSVFIQIREEKEEEVIINDSYDIHEEEYVSDYENVHIEIDKTDNLNKSGKVNLQVGGSSHLSPGIYNIKWSAVDDNEKHVVSGIYFFQLMV